MLILTVVEKIYRKGTNWKEASKDENKFLIGDIDLEDEKIPVIEKDPGDFYFTEDFVLKLYKIESDSKNEQEFAIIECLKEMRFSDPKELRYWFKGVSTGIHRLKVKWGSPDRYGESCLEYIAVNPIEFLKCFYCNGNHETQNCPILSLSGE